MFLQLKCRFPGSRGGSPSGGSPSGGVLHLGGSSIWGVPPSGRFSIPLGGSPCRGGSPCQGEGSPSGGFSILGGSPSGGSPSRGVSMPEGGFSIPGGFSMPGGGSPSWGWGGGVLHWGGWYHVTYPIMHLMLLVCCLLTETHQQCSCLYSAAWSCDLQGILGYQPPPVNRITHTCKNITFPQLRLRAVKTKRLY